MDIKKKQARHARESLLVPLIDDEAGGLLILAQQALKTERERLLKRQIKDFEDALDLELITPNQFAFILAILTRK
jgi:hypothetical protein